MSIYTDNGYKNRKDYLENLADEMGIDTDTVFMMASVLGSSEDFDGLVTSLEDMADGYF
jgi:hypothetical protein